jgi:hypothetical protein
MILNHYKGYFHRILVASPTVDSDEKWDVVKKTKHLVVENKKLKAILGDGIDPKTKKNIPKIVFGSGEDIKREVKRKFSGKLDEKDFVMHLDDIMPELEKQKKMIYRLKHDLKQEEKAKFIADRILIVLDDQAGLFKGGNFNNPITNFVLKHRHYNTSLIIVTQAYKAIPKTIRINCDQMVVFDNANMSEVECIYEERPCDLDFKNWFKMFKYATQEPFTFLYVNDRFPKGQRAHKNFTEKIVTWVPSKKTKKRFSMDVDDEDDQ